MKDLERMVSLKIKPLIDQAMSSNLGITIPELNLDISDKIKKSPLLEFDIDTSIKFKTAKKLFKKQYIARLLQLHLGNIAEVARISKVDRRTIHRLIKELNIDIDKFREVLMRGEYVKRLAVQNIIESSLESYKDALNEQKYAAFYSIAPELSHNIVKELPDSPLSLKDAEKEFEDRYFKQALSDNSNNISMTARKIGLRFETLHRKLNGIRNTTTTSIKI